MTTTFVLIRHGQTAWNRDVRFRGTIDIALNKLGRAQARRAAEWLREEPIRAIYSSPLSRAMDTAEPLAQVLGLPIQPEPRILSVDYGEWQGHSPREVSRLWPDLYQVWLKSPEKIQFPGGGSLVSVRDQAAEAVAEIADAHPDQMVALVSHEIVTKVLMLLALGMDLSSYWRIPQDNGCIDAFTFASGKWALRYLNSTCHLRGLAQT